MLLETDFPRILNSLTFTHIKKQSNSPTSVFGMKPLSQYDTIGKNLTVLNRSTVSPHPTDPCGTCKKLKMFPTPTAT